MAYVTPSTLMTGCLVTAARWNQDVVSNPEALNPGGWSVVLGDGVSVIPTGSALDVEVPFNCPLSAWGIYQSPSGSLEVTLCRMTYAGFPATASVIVGSSPIRSPAAPPAHPTTPSPRVWPGPLSSLGWRPAGAWRGRPSAWSDKIFLWLRPLPTPHITGRSCGHCTTPSKSGRAHSRLPSALQSSTPQVIVSRSEEHTSELQSRLHLVCR